jgi:hypothetical protein
MTRCTCDPDDDTSAEHRQCVACYEDASVTDPLAAILVRAAAERAEADRLDAAADPIRAAMHYHCARVLEDVVRASSPGVNAKRESRQHGSAPETHGAT